jgi:hypothetical protein
VSAEDSSAEEESDSEDENAGRKSRDKYYTFHSESCKRRTTPISLITTTRS